MNESVYALGYPENVIREYNSWVLLLRKTQITIGSLVLAVKDDCTSILQLSDDAYNEYRIVVKDTEHTLRKLFKYDKVNYLQLMMLDKHLHYHIIPRYEKVVLFNNVEYRDMLWPKPPDLSKTLDMAEEEIEALHKYLINNWLK